MSWYVNPIDGAWDIMEEFDTKEKAIEYGVQEYKDHLAGISTELFDLRELFNDVHNYPDHPSGWFEVGERMDFIPEVYADLIIDQVVEQAYCQCGEISEDWLRWDTITEEQLKELQGNMQKVFDEWLKKHDLEPTFYNIVNIEEIDANNYV